MNSLLITLTICSTCYISTFDYDNNGNYLAIVGNDNITEAVYINNITLPLMDDARIISDTVIGILDEGEGSTKVIRCNFDGNCINTTLFFSNLTVYDVYDMTLYVGNDNYVIGLSVSSITVDMIPNCRKGKAYNNGLIVVSEFYLYIITPDRTSNISMGTLCADIAQTTETFMIIGNKVYDSSANIIVALDGNCLDFIVTENSVAILTSSVFTIYDYEWKQRTLISASQGSKILSVNSTSLGIISKVDNQLVLTLRNYPIILPPLSAPSTPLNTPSNTPVSDTPSNTPDGSIVAPSNTQQDIVPIVVPVVVGVVIIAVAIVITVILKRRRQRQRRRMANVELRLVRTIGKGSYGEVFLAKYNGLEVAAKMAKDSVKDEINLLTKLPPHPNIVQMLGCASASGIEYLLMEYCDGGSLDNIIYAEQDVSISKRVRWLMEAAAGMSHLHRNNIVHRDVAARNILIERGRAKVTDFGLARETRNTNTTKTEIGPIRWMAPESMSRQYSTATDVWMFGILLYEVIERREPHISEDALEVAQKIKGSGYLPTITSDSWTPELRDIFMSCCQFDASKRLSITKVLEKLTDLYNNVYGSAV